MTNSLTLFQIVSFIAYLVLVMMMGVCPYKGDEFRRFNRVRYLYMASMGVIALHFLLQLLFGFRAKSDTLGAAVNMIIAPFGDVFYTMAVFVTLNGARSLRRHWIVLSAFWCLNAAVLIVAACFTDTELLRWFVFGSIAAYMLFFLIVFVILLRSYKRMTDTVKENSAVPVEKQTEWIKHYLVFRILICLSIPCLALGTYYALTFAIVAFVGFTYFQAKFMYFGYYVRAFDDANGNDNTLSSTGPYDNGPGVDERAQINVEPVRLLLDAWVKKENYCNPNVTLQSMAKELQLSHRSLSLFFNRIEHKSFREWITALRIVKAKRLMVDDPCLSNEDVADMCGFSSRSYFQTSFRTLEGATPGEWRTKNCGA